MYFFGWGVFLLKKKTKGAEPEASRSTGFIQQSAVF